MNLSFYPAGTASKQSCLINFPWESPQTEEVASQEFKIQVVESLPDGSRQIFWLYVFGRSGLKDYGSATLHCKIAPLTLHPGAIQRKEGIKFGHLATLIQVCRSRSSFQVENFPSQKFIECTQPPLPPLRPAFLDIRPTMPPPPLLLLPSSNTAHAVLEQTFCILKEWTKAKDLNDMSCTS